MVPFVDTMQGRTETPDMHPLTFGTTTSCTRRRQNHPTWQQRTQHLNSMWVIMFEWHEDLAFWKSDHWRANGLRTCIKLLTLTIDSCHWCTKWRIWKAVASRSAIIGNSWQANANHSQHRLSRDPRVERNPMHWEMQQDHIDPLRGVRRRSVPKMFENDRDALHTT